MLTNERIIEIENCANKLLYESLGSISLSTPLPINVHLLAKSKGLDISMVDFDDIRISGAFDGKKIQISRKDGMERQSFTIAHEIGHSLLHGNLIESDHRVEVLLRKDLDDPMTVEDPTETEANVFASAILMPRTIVDAFEECGMGSTRMADTFGVSPAIMNYRLMRKSGFVSDL